MKALKKVIFVILSVSIFMTMTGTSTVLADSGVRKGTVRVVINVLGDESNVVIPCSDEIVYNEHRYLPSIFFVGLLIANSNFRFNNEFEIAKKLFNASNKSTTFHLSPYGYISFFGGTNKLKINEREFILRNTLVYYDNETYVSMEDIADTMDFNYGFDASKNTIYFY